MRQNTKPKKGRTLSNVTKPCDLSLTQWQIRLRAQAAGKEAFGISEDSSEGRGIYQVVNGQTRVGYQVEFHGEGHPLNGCTCMDFRTSRLGTCKHLEAVKSWLKAKRKRPGAPDEAFTTLYMDYTSAPTVKIRYGEEDSPVLSRMAAPLFDASGTLTEAGGLALLDFIKEASVASRFFRCRPDVLSHAARLSDGFRRNRMLDDLFKTENWWKDVFVPGIMPYAYQLEGIRFAARAGKSILADEMGLGKTLQAIGTAMLLHRKGFVDSILVVCPTSLKYQWRKEIRTFCGEEPLVVEGGHLKRKRLYRGDELFKIVSYNAVSNDIKILKSLRTDMLILDEVQRLKNWNTQLAKSARKIQSDYSLILSGTPLENKLDELYSIVQLVDQYRLGPYYLFRSNHILTDDTGKVLGYKGLNQVGAELAPILLRRRKADVALQLPERMDKNLFVPMTKVQREMHEEFKSGVARLVLKWRRMHFLSETDRKRLLLLLSQMRMVCDSTYILDQKSRDDTKIEETMDILDSILSSEDEKAVIFSQWERMTRLVAQELDAVGIPYEYLHGGVPSAKRKGLIDRFAEDPSVRVFISTDAGATGLNLQTASYVINLDLPWNPAVLEQRIGRIYRIGQRRNIQVINLVATDTIEEQMLAKLKFKSSLFDGVLNGGEDSIFLDDNKLEAIVSDFDFSPAEENVSEPGKESIGAEARTEPLPETEPLFPEEDQEESERRTVSPEEGPERRVNGTQALVPEPDEEEEGDEVAQDVLSKGSDFFGSLLNALKSPESTEQLVRSLVVEDEKTGKASLNIPVKSRDSVLQLARLIGRMLNG